MTPPAKSKFLSDTLDDDLHVLVSITGFYRKEEESVQLPA